MDSLGNCTLNPLTAPSNSGSQANLQTFHSSTDAARGAREEASSRYFLDVYQVGVYVLTTTLGSRPEFVEAVQHAAEEL